MARDEELAAAVVRSVVAARQALGWSQRELASRAGLSQSLVSRFERGPGTTLSLGAVQRLFDTLGVRADLRADLPVGGRGQRDAVHAWCAGYVGRRLEAGSFVVRHEVEVGSGRFRGWIDVPRARQPRGR